MSAETTNAAETQEQPDTPFTGTPWLIPMAHVGDELKRRIEGSDEVCRWVEQELEVDACKSLICDINLAPARRGRVTGTLRLRLNLVQTCVVTVEPFDVLIDETVDAEFWPPAQIEAWDSERGTEAEIDDDTPDPEPIVDGRLAVGALVHQALVMAVDPHPRKPGVEFGSVATDTEADRAAEKPFAALAKLRDTLGED